MHRAVLLSAVLLAGSVLFGPAAVPAVGCPMCKTAAESDADNLQPRAYMYSILFMLTMMGSLCSVVGLTLYRTSKRERAALEEAGYGHVLRDALADRNKTP